MKKIINILVSITSMVLISHFFSFAQDKLTDNNYIPIEDIAYYYIDEYDYPCFALKDVNFQLDNPLNMSYTDIMDNLEDKTEEYKNNYIDMRRVINFKVTENGLMLYLEDGSGYYWENDN